jgi:hypothetical protein
MWQAEPHWYFALSLFFYPEDDGNIFLWNVGWFSASPRGLYPITTAVRTSDPTQSCFITDFWKHMYARFQGLMVMTIKIAATRNVTACNLVGSCWCVGVTCCSHLLDTVGHVGKNSQWCKEWRSRTGAKSETVKTLWRWRQKISPKRLLSDYMLLLSETQ